MSVRSASNRFSTLAQLLAATLIEVGCAARSPATGRLPLAEKPEASDSAWRSPARFSNEATSALDAESEELVQEALARLVRARAAFVIAHRLSTVMHADRIVVLKDGVLLEQGTHPNSWARRGTTQSSFKSS